MILDQENNKQIGHLLENYANLVRERLKRGVFKGSKELVNLGNGISIENQHNGIKEELFLNAYNLLNNKVTLSISHQGPLDFDIFFSRSTRNPNKSPHFKCDQNSLADLTKIGSSEYEEAVKEINESVKRLIDGAKVACQEFANRHQLPYDPKWST